MASISKQEALVEAKRRGLVADDYNTPVDYRALPKAIAKRALREVSGDPWGAAMDIGAMPADAIINAVKGVAKGNLYPAAGLINPLSYIGQAVSDPHAFDNLTVRHSGEFATQPEIGLGAPHYGDTAHVTDMKPAAYKGHGLDPVVTAILGSLLGGEMGRELGGERPVGGEIAGSTLGSSAGAGGSALVNDPKHALDDAEYGAAFGLGRPAAYQAMRGIESQAAADADPGLDLGFAYKRSVPVPGGRDPDPYYAQAHSWNRAKPLTHTWSKPGPLIVADEVGAPRPPSRFDPKMRATPAQTRINEIVEDARRLNVPVKSDVPIAAKPAVERVNKPRGKPIIGRATRVVRRMVANGLNGKKGAQALADELSIPIPDKTSPISAVRDALENDPHSPEALKFRNLYPNTLGLALGAGGALAASQMTDEQRQQAQFSDMMTRLNGLF